VKFCHKAKKITNIFAYRQNNLGLMKAGSDGVVGRLFSPSSVGVNTAIYKCRSRHIFFAIMFGGFKEEGRFS
jgi:hypothetical protein